MSDFIFGLFFVFVELWFDDFVEEFMGDMVIDDPFCSLFFPTKSCLFLNDFDISFRGFEENSVEASSYLLVCAFCGILVQSTSLCCV